MAEGTTDFDVAGIAVLDLHGKPMTVGEKVSSLVVGIIIAMFGFFLFRKSRNFQG